jgi:hypothetical protein
MVLDFVGQRNEGVRDTAELWWKALAGEDVPGGFDLLRNVRCADGDVAVARGRLSSP